MFSHTRQGLRSWRCLHVCHINPLYEPEARVLFALALVLALFAAPTCVLVAALLFFCLRFQGRHPHPAPLRVDRNERKICRRNMTQDSVNCMLHPHLDAYLH